MKKVYESILNVKPEQLEELRNRLKSWIIEFGEKTNSPDMVEFGKKLNRDSIEMCLHLGFSERAFLESLSGIVRLEFFKIRK
jgi:hypothetical protein